MDSQSISMCHPVLRDMLIEELHLRSPERFTYLHQRAAELLNTSGNTRQAIYHALEADNDELAAYLIGEAAEQMMDQGHTETLARWIDAFPASTTSRYPRLLLIRATIYHRQGDAHSVLPLLDVADTAVQALACQASSRDTQNLPVLQAEIALVRSKVLFRQKECQPSQLLCQQVLASLPTDEVMLRAEAYMRLGLCYIQLGDFTTGIAQIQKALQLWGRHTIRRRTADGHSVLARAYGMLGNFALAEHHMTRAIACWEQLQDSWGKVDNLVRLGNIKVRQGVFPEAETIFQEALALASGPIHYQRGQAYALDCLGIYYQRQERYERALVVTEEALALARQLHDQSLLYDTLCDLAMIYLFMGDTATALMLISEVKVQTMNGDSIGYEQAIRDLIYGTIHLFQGQYSQAWPYLSASEVTLSSVGLKQEHLQVLLRLAAYHLAQGQLLDAVHRLEAVTAIAPICEGYEQLTQMEMRHLPGLVQALRTLPELAQMRTLLHLELEFQPTQTHEKLSSVQEKAPLPRPVSPTLSPEVQVVPHTLTIVALGEPAVFLNQEPVTRWRMARAMELFFFLLDCGRPMRKERILTALWPEVDEQTDHTLHSTIYYVRKALGDSCIVSQKGTYALNLAARYGGRIEYDVTTFQNEQVKAQQALTREDTATARTALLALVDLYQGDYVEPFYSEWCRFRRDELRHAYLDARHRLAQLAWGNEQFDESVQHWQLVLAVDACQEEAHYGLMRCYLRQGKRGLALRQYQRCRETLHQELGVQPGPAMQRLHQRLVTSSVP
jgi:two-component SAPR family response regulator/Tfp pilus assembly protein PilF